VESDSGRDRPSAPAEQLIALSASAETRAVALGRRPGSPQVTDSEGVRLCVGGAAGGKSHSRPRGMQRKRAALQLRYCAGQWLQL
jgi:hypothetical protein